MDLNQTRLIGDYILGPRIGSGSFAVVWRSTHSLSGLQVAVKEIDKKLLSPKVSENLLKEISILSTINHPNIIRLFESIETEDRIFLVLEYCNGGDLAGFINRHGKVTEVVARHFMRQLAAGLLVLQEKRLIHRDLKPQNLLLSSNDATPLLKIGDFGFARSLSSQDLADTLCGSPLYMAPEIIQNKKYGAKADLWSVGAILFQLVTGKPPFDGNSQYQLFQNILTFTELRFPQGALEELHPDCVDLCRSLLRRNPVERLTFKGFFNHKFLGEPRLSLVVKQSSTLSQMKSVFDQFDVSASDTRSQLHSEHLYSATRNAILSCTSEHDNIVVHGVVHGSTSDAKSVHGSMPNIAHDRMRKSVDDNRCSLDQQGVADSLELIEKDYVIVDPHFESMENLCYSFESSLQDSCTTKVSACPSKQNDQDIAVSTQKREFTGISVDSVNNLQVHGSTRLHLLNQYAQAIAEIAQEKYNAGHFLESFSIELVVLAIWKKALRVCNSRLSSTAGSKLPETSSTNESNLVPGDTDPAIDRTDFTGPSSARKWVEEGFVAACNRAEKLSHHLRGMDAAAEMPDAMEIIFQKALATGTSAAVDEYIGNQGGVAVSYSKATLLLSFVSGEATSLPLNPPFSLTSDDKQRIQSYISNLQSHQARFSMVQPVPRYSPDSVTN